MIKINKELEKNIVMTVSKMSDEELLKFLKCHWDIQEVPEEERKIFLETYNHRVMVHEIIAFSIEMMGQ